MLVAQRKFSPVRFDVVFVLEHTLPADVSGWKGISCRSGRGAYVLCNAMQLRLLRPRNTIVHIKPIFAHTILCLYRAHKQRVCVCVHSSRCVCSSHDIVVDILYSRRMHSLHVIMLSALWLLMLLPMPALLSLLLCALSRIQVGPSSSVQSSAQHMSQAQTHRHRRLLCTSAHDDANV